MGASKRLGERTARKRLANRRRDYERFSTIVADKLARPEAELDLQHAAEIVAAAPSCLLC